MRTVVAVLRGGPSREYDVSLKTGASVLEALDKEKYEPRDIFISRGGQWHLHGVEVAPERALQGTDVAFNALHGEYGEDGQVQRLLERLGMPYTGSGTVASATAFNKQHTKDIAKKLGIKIAHGVVVENTGDLEALAHNLFRTFPHPAIIKPVASGSSIGIMVAENFIQLQHALEQAFEIGPHALVEEYIPGRQATVGIIDQYRGEKTYALLPAEVLLPKGSPFYDYHTKYATGPEYVIPGNFTSGQKNTLVEAAKKIHDGLKLSHYSRSDFIVGKRGVYFLEVNNLPDMYASSEFTHMLRSVGTKLSEFIDHVLQLARNKK